MALRLSGLRVGCRLCGIAAIRRWVQMPDGAALIRPTKPRLSGSQN